MCLHHDVRCHYTTNATIVHCWFIYYGSDEAGVSRQLNKILALTFQENTFVEPSKQAHAISV